MASGIRLSSSVLRQARPLRCPLPRQCLRHHIQGRGYARMISGPPQAEYTFGMSWQVITPLLLLGTGSVAMIIWYFSTNEFIEAGFPPRAAEAFRIAAIADDDFQLRHAIRYWRVGLEIAIAHGISPFDERILKIKGRLMETIRKEGDIGAEREVLEEIREQALQEIRAGNKTDRGKLLTLAIQASLSLAKLYPNNTDEERKFRDKEMKWAILTLQKETRARRSAPDCPTEHWGWIPQQRDRVAILRAIAAYAQEIRAPNLALNYYLEALPVYPPNHPDSLQIMVRIGTLVRTCIAQKSPFNASVLLRQSDIWLSRVVSTRQAMTRFMPPCDNHARTNETVDGTYTKWGWDRECDTAYARAVWEQGMNQRAWGNQRTAEQLLERAVAVSEELKLNDLHGQFKRARLEMQGKFEEARNPYFWE